MADGNSRDNDESPPEPTQIPLLEDVVDPGPAVRKIPHRPRRKSHSLNLDPPVIRDLFDTTRQDAAGESARHIDADQGVLRAQDLADETTSPLPESEAEKRHRVDVSHFFDAASMPMNHVPWSVVDDAPTLNPAPGESASDRQARLREGADRVVDDLVREYSQEIVRRLKDELTNLLDDLATGEPPQKAP